MTEDCADGFDPKPELEDGDLLPDHGLLSAAEAAIRAADSVHRMQALVAPLIEGCGGPVMIATISSLDEARKTVGEKGTSRDLMAALAEAQGLPAQGPWMTSKRGSNMARTELRSVATSVGSGNSFANSSARFIFVNATRAAWMTANYARNGALEEGARWASDLCLLHELGHIAEDNFKHRLREREFECVVKDIPEEWHRRLRIGPDGTKQRLRDAMAWHSRECYADTFEVSAAVALGHSIETVRRASGMEVARLLSSYLRDSSEVDPFWGRYPLWPGIYFSLCATSLALREAPPAGATAEQVANVAHRAARRGVLTPELLLTLAAGDAPDWLSDFDDDGSFANGQAMVRAYDALPVKRFTVPDEDGIPVGSTDRLFRTAALRVVAGVQQRWRPNGHAINETLQNEGNAWSEAILPLKVDPRDEAEDKARRDADRERRMQEAQERRREEEIQERAHVLKELARLVPERRKAEESLAALVGKLSELNREIEFQRRMVTRLGGRPDCADGSSTHRFAPVYNEDGETSLRCVLCDAEAELTVRLKKPAAPVISDGIEAPQGAVVGIGYDEVPFGHFPESFGFVDLSDDDEELTKPEVEVEDEGGGQSLATEFLKQILAEDEDDEDTIVKEKPPSRCRIPGPKRLPVPPRASYPFAPTPAVTEE